MSTFWPRCLELFVTLALKVYTLALSRSNVKIRAGGGVVLSYVVHRRFRFIRAAKVKFSFASLGALLVFGGRRWRENWLSGIISVEEVIHAVRRDGSRQSRQTRCFVCSLSYVYLCLSEPWTSLRVFSLPGGTSPQMGQRLYKSPGVLMSYRSVLPAGTSPQMGQRLYKTPGVLISYQSVLMSGASPQMGQRLYKLRVSSTLPICPPVRR